MFFLNLSLGEFLTLLGALSGLITALYFFDRARRRKTVSSLRFWVPEGASEAQQSRRRVREPWSLILQLASLLLLLLALAQLQWGTRSRRGQDHVLLMDTSSWARSHAASQTVLDQEKQTARAYLTRLAPGDRVMLVAADSLATPLTPFTSDRAQLLTAIAGLRAGYSALNLDQVLRFGRQALTFGQTGDSVYVGPHLVGSHITSSGFPGLRVLSVPVDRENCGIRQLTVRQPVNSLDTWEASIKLKNYGSHAQNVRLDTGYKGTAFSPRFLALPPGSEESVEYTFITKSAGDLIVSISPGGSLAEDDRVRIRLPQIGAIKVAVYTARRRLLQPLLEANRELTASFFLPAQYRPKPDAELVVLDSFNPASPPLVPSLWIHPPADGSPLAVKTTISNAVIHNVSSMPEMRFGSSQLRLPSAEVFQKFEDDQSVAGLAEGPVIVLRPDRRDNPRLAVVGFDPLAGELRYEVATPLLFANLLRWLSPDTFRNQDFTAEHVGTAEVKLDAGETSDRLRVTDDRGFAVPFTLRDNTLRLFVSRPTAVRIASPQHHRVLSLVLPEVAERAWKAPASVPQALPPALPFTPPAADLWQWFAVLGGAGLLSEWMLFGRQRARLKRKPSRAVASSVSIDQERELAAK